MKESKTPRGEASGATPPGLQVQEASKTERSTGPWESVLMRRQSKPQVENGVSTGTQTGVYLEHQVKSITWIPVVDTVEPVHDIDKDFYDEADEDIKELAHQIDDGLGTSDEISSGSGDVNDVDALEISRSKLGECEDETDDEAEPPSMTNSDDEEWEPHTMSYAI